MLLSQTSTRLPEEAISQLRSKLHGELVEFNYNMGLPTLHVNLYDVCSHISDKHKEIYYCGNMSAVVLLDELLVLIIRSYYIYCLFTTDNSELWDIDYHFSFCLDIFYLRCMQIFC